MALPLSPDHARFAHDLAAARLNGTTLDTAPPVATVAEAMAIQQGVLDAMADRAAGWKISLHRDYGTLGGPLPAKLTGENGMALALPAPVAVEVEIAYRIGHDLAAGDHPDETLLAALDGQCVGVELVRPRLSGGTEPYLPYVADSNANEAYIAGPWQPISAFDITAHPCRITLDGAVFYEAPTPLGQGEPFAVLRAAMRDALATGGTLKAGAIITTGSRCGMVALPQRAGQEKPIRIKGKLLGLGAVEFHLTVSPRP